MQDRKIIIFYCETILHYAFVTKYFEVNILMFSQKMFVYVNEDRTRHKFVYVPFSQVADTCTPRVYVCPLPYFNPVFPFPSPLYFFPLKGIFSSSLEEIFLVFFFITGFLLFFFFSVCSIEKYHSLNFSFSQVHNFFLGRVVSRSVSAEIMVARPHQVLFSYSAPTGKSQRKI